MLLHTVNPQHEAAGLEVFYLILFFPYAWLCWAVNEVIGCLLAWCPVGTSRDVGLLKQPGFS